MTASDDPDENLATVLAAIKDSRGADLLLTPEVSNCVSTSRDHQNSVLHLEVDDPFLIGVSKAAAEHAQPILLGSVALKTGDPEGRFANRSILIDAEGHVTARYDKAHMFDVNVSEEESYLESDGFRPGTRMVTASLGDTMLGLSICYDVRFPHLYRRLAQAGAQILTVPAAFSYVTGQAHWEVLLRARAIETGSYVVAPAQTGQHAAKVGKKRKTHGHSLVVSPWGEVLLDAGTDPGVFSVDIDLEAVTEARVKIPSLTHERLLKGPL